MVTTKLLKICPTNIDVRKISQAALVIRKGGLVAFPTETVYGLGANALDPKAVAKIFRAKGRPADNPLIVHVADKKDFERLASEVPRAAKKLIDKFCPGPLTLVLKKSNSVPKIVSGGLDTVAIRMPAHPVALKLIKKSKVPIAAPSANISGRPSPTNAKHVIEDLYGKVDVIIDAGKTNIGVESTVVDMTADPPMVLRPGNVTVEQLRKAIGSVGVHKERGMKKSEVRSPGMKYRHYAPKARVILVEGPRREVIKKIERCARIWKRKGKRVGIMAMQKCPYNADTVILVGITPKAVAKNLFSVLREFDKRHVDIILAEGINERGVGLAVMNRLRKAAGRNTGKA